MIWNEKNQDRELLSYYKKLIGIRNKEESIKTGIFTVNLCERRVYGFIRSLPDSEIYIVINAGNEPVTIDVPVFHKGMYKELLNNTGYTTNDGKKKKYYNDDINRYEGVISLSLDVYDGKVIKRREKE